MSSVCTLSAIPQDILLRCVVEYLEKRDQYKLLSLCCSWRSLLYQCRVIHINEDDEKDVSHEWYWFKTSEEYRDTLLRVCGLQLTDGTACIRRPLQLTVNFEEAVHATSLLLQYIQYFNTITITYKQHAWHRYKEYLPATVLTTPTYQGLTRFLQSCWGRVGRTQTLQTLWEVSLEASRNVQPKNSDIATQGEIASFSSLQGVHRLLLQGDRSFFVEMSPESTARLHSVVLLGCDGIDDVTSLRNVPEVHILDYRDIRDLSALAQADTLTLKGLDLVDVSVLGSVRKLELSDCTVSTANQYPVASMGKKGQKWKIHNVDITDVSGLVKLEKLTLMQCDAVRDISMLGSVQRLVVQNCKEVVKYPVPSLGKGQAWEFHFMNIADVSSLARLEKLTLLECPSVTDISMLGHVQYLTIDGCEGLTHDSQFPTPLEKFQQWSLNDMVMDNIAAAKFSGIYSLKLHDCEGVSLAGIKNIVRLELNGCTLLDASIANIAITSLSLVSQTSIINIGEEVNISELNIEMQDVFPLVLSLSTSARASLQSLLVTQDLGNCITVELTKETLVDVEVLLVNKDHTHRIYDSSSLAMPPAGVILNNASLRTAVWLWFKDVSKAVQLFGDISTWDVSQVTDMSKLFCLKKNFNSNITSWNVNKVTDMSKMFYGASSFNQPLNKWDVSNVTNMCWMFSEATFFNQPLDNWDVGNVANMSFMFIHAAAFNQPLDSWNVINVADMSQMFLGATSFDQPLDSWNVSNVVNMSYMFREATSFNQPINSWNVSQVTNMSSMFKQNNLFSQPLDNWNVEKVTTMDHMFCEASSFNQPLESWKVRNDAQVNSMFKGAISFNQPLESWNMKCLTGWASR